MDHLTPDQERAYFRLYADRPTTTQGRVERAIRLLGLGWGNSRAYDDCFEAGDGEIVLARLLRHVADVDLSLRQAMIEQRRWSREYEPPEQLLLL